MIIVVSIGIGPFVQQMATIRNNRVNSDVPASTTRTEAFTEISGLSSMMPTSNMMSAIYNLAPFLLNQIPSTRIPIHMALPLRQIVRLEAVTFPHSKH